MPTLTSADILAGELPLECAQLVKDAYDLAYGYAADPAAVESAVNGTAAAHRRRVRVAWAAGSHTMGFDPNGIIASGAGNSRRYRPSTAGGRRRLWKRAAGPN